MNVADLKKGGKDALGYEIRRIYGFKPPHYAVYGVRNRLAVQFADDPTEGDQQRQLLAQLAPIRGEIDGLIDGWREGSAHSFFGIENASTLEAKAGRYERRVGDAMVAAFENQMPIATATLTAIKADIVNERTAWARFEYLIAAFSMALALLFATWLAAETYPLTDTPKPDHRMLEVGLVLLAFAAATVATLFLAGRAKNSKPDEAAADKHADGQRASESKSEPHVSEGQARNGGQDAPEAEAQAQAEAGKGPAPIWVAFLLFAFLAIPVCAVFISPSFSYGNEIKGYDTAIALWRAAAAGAVGAFFSIATGMRTRTVLPDLLRTSNVMDAILRITIGFIAGAVLLALLKENVVTVQIGNTPIMRAGALTMVLIGFLGGFSERMVPDLLAKASASTGGSQRPQTPSIPPQDTGGGSGSAGKGGGGTGAAGADKPSTPPAPPADPVPEQTAEDSCVADIEAKDQDITPDIALPPAAGGVAQPGAGGGK